MITDYINEILTTHRDNLSIDELIKVLKEYNIYAVNNNVYKIQNIFLYLMGDFFETKIYRTKRELFLILMTI